jgi:hypothetical protein
MRKEQKFLPEGYRFLSPGESVNKGDFFWSEDKNKWLKIVYPDDTTVWVKEQIIRPIKQS